MTATADYLRWRRQAAVGCVFARMIAARPRAFGQAVEEISGRGVPQRVAAAIAKRVAIFVADGTISATALLLPGISSLKKLTSVALELGSHPGWTVTTTDLQEPRNCGMVAVHVARQIPFGNASCPSEVLVLGPFGAFPPTRRAPMPVMEIFVGEPMPHDPKNHKPTVKANLAHMDVSESDLDPQQIDRMWQMSVSGRLRSLGGVEDSRAKAKVAFVIPASLADELGCAP